MDGKNQPETYLILTNSSVSRSRRRTGPFEASADLEESMEFVEPEVAGPAEESGDELVTDEETDLGTDWETVPSPRFCDIPSQVRTPGRDL